MGVGDSKYETPSEEFKEDGVTSGGDGGENPSSIVKPASTSDNAVNNAEHKTDSAQEVVDQISGVVFKQESFIQENMQEINALKSELAFVNRRKNKYKKMCKDAGLIN
jgi:hypothetical protein